MSRSSMEGGHPVLFGNSMYGAPQPAGRGLPQAPGPAPGPVSGAFAPHKKADSFTTNPDKLQFYSSVGAGGGAAGAAGGPGGAYGHGRKPSSATSYTSNIYGGGGYPQYSAAYAGQGRGFEDGRYPAPGQEAVGIDYRAAFGTGGFPDEPPLLEELGINFSHIKTKTLSVLNPLRSIDREVMEDADLAGPLVFCLLFGAALLLSGKISFGYIYGVAITGVVSLWALLNMMSDTGIDWFRTASVLGYCLLPMVLLSCVRVVFSYSGLLAAILPALSVAWCTYAASTMFVTSLRMDNQRALVAYPVGLLYGIFALLAVF